MQPFILPLAIAALVLGVLALIRAFAGEAARQSPTGGWRVLRVIELVIAGIVFLLAIATLVALLST